jgi:hypothetical protein
MTLVRTTLSLDDSLRSPLQPHAGVLRATSLPGLRQNDEHVSFGFMKALSSQIRRGVAV